MLLLAILAYRRRLVRREIGSTNLLYHVPRGNSAAVHNNQQELPEEDRTRRKLVHTLVGTDQLLNPIQRFEPFSAKIFLS
jgi:hypothetical protein